MKKNIISVLISIALIGCASSGNQSLKNETQETVKTKLVKGKTKKQDVLASFGEPDNRSTTDGEEQWSYTMYNSQAKSTSYIPVVGFLMGGANSQTKSLAISFKDEKVSSYSFSSGVNHVKTGVF